MRSTRQANESFTSPPTNAAASTELNVCEGPERRPVTRYEGFGDAGEPESMEGEDCAGGTDGEDSDLAVEEKVASSDDGMER